MESANQDPRHPIRCSWCEGDELYEKYHDEEWGRPEGNAQKIFEKLCLEGFQAGLSWITILRKRDNFRRAFASFDPVKVAAFTEKDICKLLDDAGIVRHRKKIEATIANAQAFLSFEENQGSFAEFIWTFAPIKEKSIQPQQLLDIPSVIPESENLAKELRKLGFRFLGPTTVYAAMQSLGLVNDHVADCWAQSECTSLRDTFVEK